MLSWYCFAVLNTLLLKGQFPRYTHCVKCIDKGVLLCVFCFFFVGGGLGEERFDTEANSHGPGNGITGDLFLQLSCYAVLDKLTWEVSSLPHGCRCEKGIATTGQCTACGSMQSP